MVSSFGLIMNYGKELKNLWLLRDDVVFLNHGSFGATPISVLKSAQEVQERMESQPIEFFLDHYFLELRKSAGRLANFIGADSDGIGFVDNATSGVNAVLRSLSHKMNSNYEILITTQTYPAVKAICYYLRDTFSCTVKEIELPFPCHDPQEYINIYRESISDKTKLVIIDHIFYTSGVVAPVKELIDLIKSKGSLVLVDGAHAPGMIPLNIESLGADWYAGNCHKWLFAPKGCAFLWTSEEHRAYTKPPVISFNLNQGYYKEFDWTGTRNPSPYIALRPAIEFHKSLDSANLMKRNHQLAVDARRVVADKLGLELPCTDDMVSTLATLPFTGKYETAPDSAYQLRREFYGKYRIEMPFIEFNHMMWFRFSAQAYNDMSDYEYLADSMKEFIGM
jgi:isopenicillin-N epimerase